MENDQANEKHHPRKRYRVIGRLVLYVVFFGGAYLALQAERHRNSLDYFASHMAIVREEMGPSWYTGWTSKPEILKFSRIYGLANPLVEIEYGRARIIEPLNTSPTLIPASSITTSGLNASFFRGRLYLDFSSTDWRRLPELQKIRYLMLTNVLGTQEGFAAMGRLPRLTQLMWTGSQLRDQDFSEICRVSSLVELTLHHNYIEGDSLDQLSNLKSLEVLDLSNNRLLDKHFRSLPDLPYLRKLKLNKTSVGYFTLQAIGEHLPGLEELNLSETTVTHQGLDALAGLKHLKILRLERVHMGDAGLEQIARIESLEKLYITESNNYTKLGLDRLAEARPDLKVIQAPNVKLVPPPIRQ